MSDVENMSFEDAIKELEKVVGQLERGDVALDESIALYERGAALKARCEAKLKEAEETEPHRRFAFRMMARRTDGNKGIVGLTAQHHINGAHNTPCGTQSGGQRPRRHMGIGI